MTTEVIKKGRITIIAEHPDDKTPPEIKRLLRTKEEVEDFIERQAELYRESNGYDNEEGETRAYSSQELTNFFGEELLKLAMLPQYKFMLVEDTMVKYYCIAAEYYNKIFLKMIDQLVDSHGELYDMPLVRERRQFIESSTAGLIRWRKFLMDKDIDEFDYYERFGRDIYQQYYLRVFRLVTVRKPEKHMMKWWEVNGEPNSAHRVQYTKMLIEEVRHDLRTEYIYNRYMGI